MFFVCFVILNCFWASYLGSRRVISPLIFQVRSILIFWVFLSLDILVVEHSLQSFDYCSSEFYIFLSRFISIHYLYLPLQPLAHMRWEKIITKGISLFLIISVSCLLPVYTNIMVNIVPKCRTECLSFFMTWYRGESPPRMLSPQKYLEVRMSLKTRGFLITFKATNFWILIQFCALPCKQINMAITTLGFGVSESAGSATLYLSVNSSARRINGTIMKTSIPSNLLFSSFKRSLSALVASLMFLTFLPTWGGSRQTLFIGTSSRHHSSFTEMATLFTPQVCCFAMYKFLSLLWNLSPMYVVLELCRF